MLIYFLFTTLDIWEMSLFQYSSCLQVIEKKALKIILTHQAYEIESPAHFYKTTAN